MKHLLVTTDFSPESEVAFKHVKQLLTLCASNNPKCTILTVLEDLSRRSVQYQFASALLESHGVREQLWQQAKNELARIKDEHFADFQVQAHVMLGSRTVDADILAYAEEHGVDLLVIATHGRTGLSHMFLGSVSEKLIRQSTIPVLVVPVKGAIPKDEQTEENKKK